MKKFDYRSAKWSDYIITQIGKAILAARLEQTVQQVYVFRTEDAETIMNMLDILSTVSEYAFLIEVRYVRLN